MQLARNILIGLIVTILAIAALMMLPSPQPDAAKPWEVKAMPDGNSEVLGIHLGKTTFKQAQQKLGILGESALFTDPDGKASLEAFFESINLGGLSAKLVLTLSVPADELSQIQARASVGKLQPSMARYHELSEQDKAAALQAPIQSITYIPSVRLSEEMLQSRFGKPAEIKTIEGEKDASRWLYPDIHMEARLKKGQRTVLLFTAN